MATATLTLPATDTAVLTVLKDMPAQLPLSAKAVHRRITGLTGTPAEQNVTAQRLDQLAVNALVTRTSGYMGKPGKFYAITDRGVAALRS